MWELKLLDAKRKAEESDRLKTFFLSNISHEIRTPLNGVLGFARLLTETEPGSEDSVKYTEMISSSADMLLQLFSNIIDFARIESGELQLSRSRMNVNGMLSELLDECKHDIKENNKVEVELYCIPGLADQSAEIMSDPKRLKQVMHCLLTNAVKFTDSGRIEFGYAAESRAFLEFFVRDTGIGITPEQQELVFQFFRQVDGSDTRRHGGAGLGLALAKKLVEMMGGVIWVESNHGKGTTLKFTVPR
jgi:signal transduction histidine kinase